MEGETESEAQSEGESVGWVSIVVYSRVGNGWRVRWAAVGHEVSPGCTPQHDVPKSPASS